MPSAPEPPPRAAALAVVVMGYRNAATIVAAVRSVLEQIAPEPFEVVVVSSGGDDSADRVRAAFPQVTVYDSPTRLLPGAARNAGIARTRAPIVSFLAADCEARPGWIAARMAAHRAGYRAVASGMAHAGPRRPAPLAQLYLLYAARLPGRCGGLVAWPDPAAHGLSFERGLLGELAPFNEDIRIGEDTIVAQQLAARGVDIWFEPRVRTAHRGPATLVELVTDAYRRGRRIARVVGPPHLHRPLWWILRAEGRLIIGSLGGAFLRTWRRAPQERRALLLCTPWMLAAATARRLGRFGAAQAGPVSPSEPRSRARALPR